MNTRETTNFSYIQNYNSTCLKDRIEILSRTIFEKQSERRQLSKGGKNRYQLDSEIIALHSELQQLYWELEKRLEPRLCFDFHRGVMRDDERVRPISEFFKNQTQIAFLPSNKIEAPLSEKCVQGEGGIGSIINSENLEGGSKGPG